MLINNACRKVFTRPVNYGTRGICTEFFAYFLDFSVGNEYICIGKDSIFFIRPHRGVLDKHRFWFGNFIPAKGNKRIYDIADFLRNDGWLVAKPAKPDFSRKYRVDRVALQNLVQAGRKKGAASLDDLAAFVEKVPSPNEAPLAQTYLMMYVPGSITTSMAGMTLARRRPTPARRTTREPPTSTPE